MAHVRRPGEMDLPPGTRLLDRYTILERVDGGGMATIYRATDERLDRVVCVKLLRTTIVEGSGGTSGRAVYQATYSHFLQEALALSKLSHPNTLRIYDFGYVDREPPEGAPVRLEGAGAPFHVSEYLDGGNLESHVRARGPLGSTETLDILDSITGAIAEAHEVGIIHRDIKPSNILFARVRDELVPKLADFGIAQSGLKKRGGMADQSISTVALFSPRWAAPEQLCGSPEGPRTDVYALALVVTFMLSGQFLFDDENVRDTFESRVRDDKLVRTRLAAVARRFPQDGRDALVSVLEEALASRPGARIGTAPELHARLREALAARAASAPQAFILPPAIEPPDFASGSDGAVTLEVRSTPPERDPSGAHLPPTGPRQVRLVRVHERLDLSFDTPGGVNVRLRVTMLPSATHKLHIKGLTCFVGRRGQRPAPAVTVDADGAVDLVSASRQALGTLACLFGRESPGGWLFVVDGRQLLVPYSEARESVALMLAAGNDIIVMCRQP